MRRISVLCTLFVSFCFVICPCWAGSAGNNGLSFGVKGGLHMPMGDYEDIADNGFTLGAEISTPLNDNVTGGLSLSYNETDVSYAMSNIFDVDGDISMIEVLLYADYNFTPSMFFLRGCAGVNVWEVEVGSEDDDGNDFMVAVGGGLNLTENLQLLVLFNRMFEDEDVDYLNITLGFKF